MKKCSNKVSCLQYTDPANVRQTFERRFIPKTLMQKVPSSSLFYYSEHPADTGYKLNVHKTFNLYPVSTE